MKIISDIYLKLKLNRDDHWLTTFILDNPKYPEKVQNTYETALLPCCSGKTISTELKSINTMVRPLTSIWLSLYQA